MAPKSVSADADTLSTAAAADNATPETNTRTQFRAIKTTTPFKPPHPSPGAAQFTTVPPQKTKAGFLFFNPGNAATEASNTGRTATAPPERE